MLARSQLAQSPRKQDNKIHVNQKDVASNEVVDLILEALIENACS